MNNVRILAGDNRKTLPTIPSGVIDCCVTSPPYFNQRDYGTVKWEGGDQDCDHVAAKKKGRYDYAVTESSPIQAGKIYRVGTDGGYYASECPTCGARRVDGQIGLESSPAEYVREIVNVCREVKRVLKDCGTLWINLGDKIEDKNLLGIPWRVAFALQADGWILRQDIIWFKPNAMPQSVKDRPTTAHEYIFLLSKQPSYYYDHFAIREPAVTKPHAPGNTKLKNPENAQHHLRRDGNRQDEVWAEDGNRTKRSVFIVPVAQEKEKHFAAFPPDLITPCILAGTSAHGVCKSCGTPWYREVESLREPTRPGHDTKVTGESIIDGNRDKGRHITEYTSLGFKKGCSCATNEVVPATVLDPFGGTFTTAGVAIQHGRRAVVCELNPEYIEIGKRKLERFAVKQGFGLIT